MASSKIQKFLKPKVVLQTIHMADTETDAAKQAGNPTMDNIKPSNFYGTIFPIIQINGKIFEPHEITKFELDCTGDIPRIYCILKCYDNYFISKKFPRDGGTISIFISSKDDSFTPIRNDYLITSISSNDNSGMAEGFFSTLRIGGVLDLPAWSGDQNQAIQGNSFSVMKKIAKDLNLGFASNINSTSDDMNWVCPYDNYEKWIHDVTRSSYNGENSFFKSFIDQYYFLNFVDMNLPFSEDVYLDQGMLVDAFSNTINTKAKNQKVTGGLLLTNLQLYKMSNIHIDKYNVINNTGNSALNDGYIRVVQFYDRDTNIKWELPVDTLITKGNEQLDVLQGRTNDEKNQKIKYTWLGLSDSDNVHDNYIWAQINNFQNNRHIGKLYLNIDLDVPNFNLYRGMRVPILITYTNNQEKIDSEKNTAKEGNNPVMTYDKFISGYYVIGGMKYKFDNTSAKFVQEVTLYRREWPKVAAAESSNTTFQQKS